MYGSIKDPQTFSRQILDNVEESISPHDLFSSKHFRICLLIQESRYHRTVFNLLMNFAYCAQTVQLLFITLFPNCDEYWSNEKKYYYYRNFLSIFIRVVTNSSTHDAHCEAILFMFTFFLWSFFFLFITYINYKQYTANTFSAMSIFPSIPFALSRVFLVPCVCHIFWVFLNIKNGVKTIYVVIALINLILCVAGYALSMIFFSAFPSFSSILASRWTISPYFLHIIFIMALAALYESVPYVSDSNYRLILIYAIPLMTFFKMLNAILHCPYVTVRSNTIFVSFSFLGFLYPIIITSTIKSGMNITVWVMLCVVLILPVIVFFNFIIKKRIIYLKSMNDFCIEAHKYDKLLKFPKLSAITAICVGFDGRFDSLDWLLEHFPQDFSVIALYTKFLLLFPEKHHRLYMAISKMRSLCHLNFQNKITTCFFDYLFFVNCSDSTEVNSSACKVVDDYLMSLHLFWTEVLLGRKKRLISLSHEVNKKFLMAKSFFSLFGKTAESLENYERFRSISSIQLTSLISKEQNSIMGTIYKESKEIFPFISKEISTSTKAANRYPRSLSVEQVATDIKGKTKLYRLLIMYLPFVFMCIVGILLIVFLFMENNLVRSVWNYEKKMIDILYPIAIAYLTFPFIPLVDKGHLDRNEFKKYLPDNFIFETYLYDPKIDMFSLIDRVKEMIPELSTALLNLPYKNVSQDLIRNADFSIHFYPKESDISRNVSFMMLIDCCAYFASENVVNYSTDDFLDFYSTNASQYVTRSYVLLFNAALQFLLNYPSSIEILTMKDFAKVASYFEIASTILVFISFIIQLFSYLLAIYFTDEFFANLFVLPKVAISQLIDKLGSRISTNFMFREILDSDLKYNMTQLSYQNAPKSYTSTYKRFGLFISCSFVLTLISRFLFTPATYYNREFLRYSFTNLKKAAPGLTLPIYFCAVQHDAFELFLLSQNNITPPNGYKELLYENFQNLTTYIINDLFYYTIDPTSFPPFYNISVYLNPRENTDGAIAKRAISSSVAFMTTTNLVFLDEYTKGVFTNETMYTLAGSTLSILSKFIPSIGNELFESINEHNNEFRFGSFVIVYFYFFFMFCILVCVHSCVGHALNDPDYVVSFLSTVPPTVLANFTRGKTDFSEGQAEVAPYVFEEENAFQFLVETVILCDGNDGIVAITPSGQAMLQLDEFLYNFTDLMKKLNVNHSQLKLPPSETQTIHSLATFASGEDILLKISITPIKKFFFNKQQIEYACTVEDISQHESMIYMLNHEANRVRLLMTQLVPWPIAECLLSGDDVQPIVLPKIICMNFFLKTPIPLVQSDLSLLQNELKNLMKSCPFVAYFGRSLQMFRVVSGIFNTSMPLTEQGARSVIFAMQFIETIRIVADTIDKPIDVQCGIHAPGPVCADIVETSPPIYDIFGCALTVSETVAMKCAVNKANITRDVYELIFGQSTFEIAFENEIELLNGSVMPIHMVTKSMDE